MNGSPLHGTILKNDMTVTCVFMNCRVTNYFICDVNYVPVRVCMLYHIWELDNVGYFGEMQMSWRSCRKPPFVFDQLNNSLLGLLITNGGSMSSGPSFSSK